MRQKEEVQTAMAFMTLLLSDGKKNETRAVVFEALEWATGVDNAFGEFVSKGKAELVRLLKEQQNVSVN